MKWNRRNLIACSGKVGATALASFPSLKTALAIAGANPSAEFRVVAGADRVVMTNGMTYLNAWAGYGEPPRSDRRPARNAAPSPAPPAPAGNVLFAWSKVSGPGEVVFSRPASAATTATFSTPGVYILQVSAAGGEAKGTSRLEVKVEPPPPESSLLPVDTRPYRVTGTFWGPRVKALITSWIPHCIAQINRTDIPARQGDGGIDNFVEAAKALRGEAHAPHKGYVFSNAWVHQTVESICLALMVDPQGDAEIAAAQEQMRSTLEDWIPKILAAQEPDGYLHTAFTLRAKSPASGFPAGNREPWTRRWSAAGRANHEGYVAGYFLESAINHYQLTRGKDLRLYRAARKLADCWADHIGPAPKQEWFDGHQEMEQALVRFGRFVNEVEKKPGEKAGPGDRYISLAKFLLDCRNGGTEYDQSHLPVQQQYEAVGHAVRAVYTYSAMADVAVETHDVDYQSAVKSLWDNLVHRKYYLTGGVGSGETSEGFGPNYSLRNSGYCEACSSCGEIFFQWKLHLAYHQAHFADLYEQTLYNALYGSLDLAGRNFYYVNPLDENQPRTPWHVCPCCVGNIPRTLLMLPTWTYSKSPQGFYVNLYAGSRADLGPVAGTDVEVVQETNYPWEGKVRILIYPKDSRKFSVYVRSPQRDVSQLYRASPKADGLLRLAVNGKIWKAAPVDGYVRIDRLWKSGDRIELELPLPIQRIYASDKIVSGENLPSPTRDKVALRVGPLVYNFEKVDQDIQSSLAPGARLDLEWRGDLLQGVNVIKGRLEGGAPMLAIPYYARSNRNPPVAPDRNTGSDRTPTTTTAVVWLREK